MPDAEEFEGLHKEHAELVENYKECFSTKAGEKVLEDLKAAYGNRMSYSPDSHDTAYKEGQRSMYLRIINMITERKDQ
jgi:hypothetical protein